MSRWQRNADAFAELLVSAPGAMRASPWRRGSAVHLPRRGRLLATGDLHDNQLHLDAVLRAARLDASPDHHVVLHELIHGERLVGGMDMSHRMLAKVAELVLAHPLQVHQILANHEIAQYRRQHISKGAGDNLELFDAGLDWVYGDDAALAAEAIGAFVAAMPLAVVCANGLMVSHSLPSAAQLRYFDLRVLERALVEEDYDGPTGAAYLMTWGRGHPPEHLEALAREWGVRTFVVGHAHAELGAEVRPPSMLVLNTDHAQGRIVAIDLAADAPGAAELQARSESIQNHIPLDLGDEPGDGDRGDA